MNLPKISVIVPVYNVEPYLEQCVTSLTAQTLEDIEILLVNDASTDGSLKLAQKLAKKDKRILVLDKPHGGLGDTRNYGVKHACGEYLSFVDSDDWVDTNMYQNLYAAAQEAQADLVVFNFVRENMQNHERRESRLPIHYPELDGETAKTVFAALIGPDAKDTLWRSVEMLGSAWRRLYRRSWFLEKDLQYPNEEVVMLEDLPVSIRAHALAERVLFVGGAYYHYRYNPDSLSTRYRPQKMEKLTACYEMVQSFLEEQGIVKEYKDRHLAWLMRMAAHSSLVNCFSPMHTVSMRERAAEVSGILRNPILKQAVASNYLADGTKADRIILRILRTKNLFLVYLFYQIYSNMLLKSSKKK